MQGSSAFNQCLTVLEHASFACPANERHLVELSMQKDGTDHQTPAAQPFPTWLVQQIQQMQCVYGSSSDKGQQPDWACIQSALSVLINMTLNNPAGCQAVVTAGGMGMALRLVSSCMQKQHIASSASPRHVRVQDRQHVLTDVGPITAALGLLINLVEECEESRQQMKAMQLGSPSGNADILQLLSRLMQASDTSHALALFLLCTCTKFTNAAGWRILVRQPCLLGNVAP